MKQDSLNVMSESTLKKVIKTLIDSNEKYANFIWHGGEPFLMGINFYDKVVHYQKTLNKNNIKISNCIQTNGTILDEQWINFIKENKFNISVSLDGQFKLHAEGRGTSRETFEKIITNIKKLKQNGIDVNALCVVRNESIGYEKEIFDFFLKNNISSFGFLPMNYGSLDDCVTPENYGIFLINMFNAWINSNVENVKIREFDEYIRGYLDKGQLLCTHCNFCNYYFTINPNGDIYPCDCFPQSDLTKLGSISDPFSNIKNKNSMFFDTYNELPMDCLSCDFSNICNGGCRYYRWIINDNENVKQFYCKSTQMLYKRMKKILDSF